MNNQIIRINSKYLLPITSPVIQNGSIIIENGIIQFIGANKKCPDYTPSRTFDYPEHIIMPGLINSHTHLSLSKLKNKFKEGIPFSEWIKKIILYNHQMSDAKEIDSIKEELKNLISTGTTTVGDISKSGFSMPVMQEMGLRGIVFLEITGFKKSMEKDLLERIPQLLNFFKGDDLVSSGLSPHSPYSVSPQLAQTVFKLAKNNKLPLAIHIAETKEELEFLSKGTGPLRELLEDLNKWEPDWKPEQKTPIKYLNNLGVLKSITGIHLNYVNNDDVEIVNNNHMSVVYCPRSNNWFQRKGTYPLIKFLEKGVNVAIGTDSLASNNSLNMFDELILIKKQFPGIKNDILLEMATINGAKALGIENKVGSLERGKKADIIGLKINNKGDDIYKTIFSSQGKIVFSMVGGKIIFP